MRWEPGKQAQGVIYLIGQGAGTEITKRELEPTVGTLDIDLQGNEGIGIRC